MSRNLALLDSHTHSSMCYLWLIAGYSGRTEYLWQRPYSPKSLRYFLSGSLQNLLTPNIGWFAYQNFNTIKHLHDSETFYKNYLEKGMKGDPNKICYLNPTFTGPTFFLKCNLFILLNLLGVTLVNKIILQDYDTIIHHLYIVLCDHYPKSSLPPSPFIPPFPSPISPTHFSLW